MKHLKYYDLTTAIISLCSSIFGLSLTCLFIYLSKSDSLIEPIFSLFFLYMAFWWGKRFFFEFKTYTLYRLNKSNALISQAIVKERYTIIRQESRKTLTKIMYIIEVALENGLLLKFQINRNNWEKLTSNTLLNITYLKEPEVIISLKINNTIKNHTTQDLIAWVIKYNVIGTTPK